MSGAFPRIERVFPGPYLGLLVEPVHEGLQLVAIDAPDTPAADLDRGELARSDERVDLGDAHAEICGDVVKGQKARLYLGAPGPLVTRRIPVGHDIRISAIGRGYMDLASFALVWRKKAPLRSRPGAC
jgi:hypothetical protein